MIPAKTKGAARASLLDLGEEEKTDKVSWMDQPLLVDTMASTARIAQGLRDDETLEKMTLPEMLNAELHVLTFHSEAGVSMGAISSLKMHKGALYHKLPPNTDRFGEAAGQLPDLTENGHWYWRVCQKIHHIFFTSGLHGRISPIWAVSQRWEDQVAQGKVGNNPRSPSSNHDFRVRGSI